MFNFTSLHYISDSKQKTSLGQMFRAKAAETREADPFDTTVVNFESTFDADALDSSVIKGKTDKKDNFSFNLRKEMEEIADPDRILSDQRLSKPKSKKKSVDFHWVNKGDKILRLPVLEDEKINEYADFDKKNKSIYFFFNLSYRKQWSKASE